MIPAIPMIPGKMMTMISPPMALTNF